MHQQKYTAGSHIKTYKPLFLGSKKWEHLTLKILSFCNISWKFQSYNCGQHHALNFA